MVERIVVQREGQTLFIFPRQIFCSSFLALQFEAQHCCNAAESVLEHLSLFGFS
jgi:hypothetical protein